MAEKWYPVIDYLTCAECGSCVALCRNGVFDKEKHPSPVVIYPKNCIDHCHGCGNKCPNGAITYVGDDTGWTLPNGERQEETDVCSCSCGCENITSKEVTIEYLYLDLNTCDRCIGTDKVLDEIIEAITPTLELAGFNVNYEKIEIATEEIAKHYQFLSSPTIRVNGKDICESVSESSCGCCSEISGTNVDCRVFEYEGKSYEVPPKEMLAQEILKAAFSEKNDCSCKDYTLPENLKQFFDGKEKQKLECPCGCGTSGGNCCG